MGLLNNLKKTIKSQNVIFLIGLLVAVFALYHYSKGKGAVTAGMTNANGAGTGMAAPGAAEGAENEGAGAGMAAPGAGGPGVAGGAAGGLPSCASKPVMNPSELLPHDANNEWAKLNPRASGDFQNVNLLRSGYWNGIDTVGSSLRNANLQVRSEPPNPQNPVSIWNTSTISPDLMRVPLEIGQGTQ